MKKHLLGLTVLGAFGLAGCGGDGPAEPTESPLPTGAILTKAVFESTDSDADGYTIPLPNDLLFSGTQDLTLNIPGVSDTNLPTSLAQVAAQASDPTAGTKRGQAALSKLDGWSTTAPFSVKFKNPVAAVGLDPSSVVAGQTVRMFEVKTVRAIVKPGETEETTIRAPTGPVSEVVAELTANDFAVEVAADCELATETCAAIPSSKTKQYIRVMPKRPLKFGTPYLVVYTNGIKDANHVSVVADTTYGVVKNTTPLPTTNAAYPIQQLVNAQEGAAVTRGVDRESIVLSHVFTTQSSGVLTRGVPGVLAVPQVQAAITGVGSPATKPSFATLGGNPLALGFENFTATPGANKATIRFGEMMVPYFSKPTTTAPLPNGLTLDPGPVLESWKATLTVPGLAPDQVCSVNTPQYCNPFCGIPTDTVPVDSAVFAQRAQACNTNYALPVPRMQGTLGGFERIPMLVVTPSPTSGCTKPETGWPIVIFQHGITGNRTNALGFAIAATNACHAIVAIDQPLHGLTQTDPFSVGVKAATDALTGGNGFAPFRGYAAGGARERTFGIDLMSNASGSPFSGTNVYGAGVPGDGTADASGSWFINIYSLGSTRENLRQAVVDLMALKLAIPVMDYDNDGAADFDGTKITTIGMSLGGIAVTSFSGLDQLRVGENSVYPGQKLNAAVLNVPGGGLAKLLDGSMAFGPRIRAGLASGGLTIGTLGYEQFLWLAQTLVDSGDPINYAGLLNTSTTFPVLMQSVVGTGATFPSYVVGGANIPSDLVVPNATPAGVLAQPNPVYPSPHPLSGDYTVYSAGPLAGTEPLLIATGVTPTSTPVPLGAAPVRAAVRFIVGHHSVLLSADANSDGTDEAPMVLARSEMQTQAMTFLATRGHALPITNVGTVVRPVM